MPIEGKLGSLYIDKEQTQPLFPRTKTKAITDDDNIRLDITLDSLKTTVNSKASEAFVMNAIANAQLGGGEGDIDLSGYATKDDISILATKEELNNIDFPVDSINGKTGTVVLTATDVGALPNTTQIPSIEGLATKTYVDNKVAAMVDSAPDTLDTLNELAKALGDDPNFATTVATQIGGKVDKVDGKGLSTNDYSTAEKNKLLSIAEGANKTIVDSALSDNSTNPVQNKVVTTTISNLASYAKGVGAPLNLLDNSAFYWPVNQRGLTSYTGSRYTIDRWRTWENNATVTVNGWYVSHTKALYQYVPMMFQDTTYTLACQNINGDIYLVTGKPSENISSNEGLNIGWDGVGFVCLLERSSTKDLLWVALYEGEYTLETLPTYKHKGYGAEIVECLRYYQRHSINFNYNDWFTFVPITIPMRVTPSSAVVETLEGTVHPLIYGSSGSNVYAILPDGAASNAQVTALIELSADYN